LRIKKHYYKFLIEVLLAHGHLSNEPNKSLIFKEKPNNMGIYLGNIYSYNENKGHIKLELKDNIEIGDTLSIEGETGTYTVSELMIKNTNIQERKRKRFCNNW
jgi:hypothetical protein